MQRIEVNSPHNLVERLIRLFPAFIDEWDDGQAFGYKGDYKFHTVFLTFAPVSYQFLKDLEPRRVREFCEIINQLVEQGGDPENAVSTCLLEHASQLKIKTLIKPHLSAQAKQQLR